MSQPTALVTGSSRGIGRAIALRLSQEGFAVVVNYVRSREAAEGVVRDIEAQGGRASLVQADVSQLDASDKLLQGAFQLDGRLDLLVNNAGITSPGRKDLLETTRESWSQVLSTNLTGPFFLAQHAAREMIRLKDEGVISSGQIININSISAYAVSTNRADYCIAKAGLQMMTWLFAARLAEHGILVYEICPGVIESDMTAPVREKYDRLIAEGLTPIRRWGTAADVAAAVSAIVQGHLPFSTGERINVDGGFHIRRL